MSFEELTLRPPSGAVDVAAVTAWLADKPYVFHDPVNGDGWHHLSVDAKEMQRHLAERIADPGSRLTGVYVIVLPDQVIVDHWLPMGAERHVLELLRWLVKDGGWTVAVDQLPPEPIGDPARFFPDAERVEEIDPTDGEVTEGERITWVAGARMFIVCSSGPWRTELHDEPGSWNRVEGWRGELTAEALAAWQAVRPTEAHEYVAPEIATGRVELETETGTTISVFDAAHVPAELAPMAALLARWLDEVAGRREPGSLCNVRAM